MDSPRPLAWSDVRALNKIGAFAISRDVALNPPAFCAPSQRCLDAGPAPEVEPTADSLAQAAALAAQYAAVAGVVTVLVILQVALLAGPAFAVQLRRRQRELGLLGACGGDARTLRRTVLASGLVLGTVGAVLGIMIGWALVLALGGQFPWAPFADLVGVPLGIPPLPPEILIVAVVGIVAAVAAALVPAVMAGRGDVVDTLRGRRPLPPIKNRVPVLGVVVGVTGLLAMAYGVRILEPVMLGLGVIVGELGLVLLMPWLVSSAARIGRWLPLAPRLAVRDAGRHRMRTTAAACAIAAAAAGAVAVSAWSQSLQLESQSGALTYVQGSILVNVSPTQNEQAQVTVSASQAAAPVGKVVSAAASRATITTLTDLTTAGAKATANPGFPYCVALAAGLPPAPQAGADPASSDAPCQGRVGSGGSHSQPVVQISDPAQIGSLLGPLAPLDEARQALEAGKALVLQPKSIDTQGRVGVRVQTFDPLTSASLSSPLITMPAVEVLSGTLPADVIVGPAAFAPGGALAGRLAANGNVLMVVNPAEADSPDRPTAQDRIALGLAKAGLDASVSQSTTYADPSVLILAVGAGVTALLALLAGLMVTALALSDGRADLVTLAAVGAPPSSRRRIAASSAAFVSALGCAAGVAAGLLAARILVPLLNGSSTSTPFVLPWLMIGLLVVGVPLLTAAVAFTTTRSRVVLTRRTGD